jgi:hypothetical protein
MHDISQLHAATPSLLSLSLKSLIIAYPTQLCTPKFTQIFTDTTSVPRTLNGPSYYSFGHRLLVFRPSRILEASALRLPTTMDTPAPTVVYISNFLTMLEGPADNVFTLLDSPSILPMLDVPAPPTLDVPARQSPTLNTPATLAYNTCSNSPPLRMLGCTYGPSNSCDPGSVTAGSGSPPPLWTPDFIAPGPTNPHDPGPKAGGPRASRISLWSVNSLLPLQYPSIIIVACLITSSITFSTISQFATNDHLCIPPRSPQCLYVMCFL